MKEAGRISDISPWGEISDILEPALAWGAFWVNITRGRKDTSVASGPKVGLRTETEARKRSDHSG